VTSHSKRVALVTGGARGIGLAVAQELAASGFNLALGGRRDAKDVADVVRGLEQQGSAVIYCQGDVSSTADREATVEAVSQRFGRLDVLVNNAGAGPPVRTDILEASEENFDQMIGINLKGPYFLTQRVAQWMVEQRQGDAAFSGVIVNMSSVSATEATVNRGDYCLAKAGVAMATKLWAARLAEFGIAVYEVRPGVIRTDMTAGVTEKYNKLILEGDLTVEKRWGEPEDVGRAVGVLARGELSYATGNVIMVDGGLTLRRL